MGNFVIERTAKKLCSGRINSKKQILSTIILLLMQLLSNVTETSATTIKNLPLNKSTPNNSTPVYVYANCAVNYYKAQEDIDIDEMMGKWYVIEILDHKKSLIHNINNDGEVMKVVVNVCPIINIRYTDRGLIRLLWTEQYGDLEYSFRLFPVSYAHKTYGVWESLYPQNGSIAKNKWYTQFNGTVVVIKAVSQHVLLTFCSTNNNDDNNVNTPQQYYSILMARQHLLDKGTVIGIHNLLDRRGIAVSSIKSTCKNSGNPLSYNNSSNLYTIWFVITVMTFFMNSFSTLGL